MKQGSKKFKSGGLHEKHAVATWSVGNHLSILPTVFGRYSVLFVNYVQGSRRQSIVICGTRKTNFTRVRHIRTLPKCARFLSNKHNSKT
jgi:hypothetical protein